MPILFKQAVAVIDERTTNVCLHIAGAIVGVDDPFATLNGEMEQTPFHIACRTMIAPYMAGFVNEQRAAANRELQRRPKAERDTRGARTPPPDDGNPPSKAPPRPKPKTPPPSPRARALDLAETKRAATTTDQARRNRERLARLSAGHSQVIDGIGKTLRGERLTVAQSKALRETARDAPLTKTSLWMAVPEAGPRTFRVGGTVSNPGIRVFSSSRAVAEQGARAGSVLVVMRGGRALPVESVAPSPSRHEWIVGRVLRVVRVEELADGRTLVTVVTE